MGIYFHARNDGFDERKASQVPVWRTSDAFTPLRREVTEYAEAMTGTPPTVTDDLYSKLLRQPGEARMVEPTTQVALANLSTRSSACAYELTHRDVTSR